MIRRVDDVVVYRLWGDTVDIRFGRFSRASDLSVSHAECAELQGEAQAGWSTTRNWRKSGNLSQCFPDTPSGSSKRRTRRRRPRGLR